MSETRWYSAQRAILGCLLVYPEETCAETFHKLRPEDFGDPSLRTVFAAARDLWLQQRPVDPVTVQASLGSEYDTRWRCGSRRSRAWKPAALF